MKTPVLEVRGICKRFPGVRALEDVHLKLHHGEILAVIGENGAGKSTLMKSLGGIVRPDGGRIFFKGRETRIDSVMSATELGIALIHQELNLADNLDIGSNVFLGREPRRGGPLRLVDSARIYRETERLLDRLGMLCSPSALVVDLAIGQQQMVEIAKALSVDATVLIMDEPTSSLSRVETEQFFGVVRELRSQGVSIIYVSHRLGEVKEIADRVMALRDGCNSGELGRDELDHDQMVKLMVGRNIKKFYHHTHNAESKPVLRVAGLKVGSSPQHPIDLTLHAGEILVIAGLVGAGRTELLHTLFGINRPVGGKIFLGDREVAIRNPWDAIQAGIGLVPEDRRLDGLILEMAVEENMTLAGLDRFQKMKFMRLDRLRSVAEERVKEFGIRTPGIEQEVQLLSGGNQQKVVLAKWLLLEPKVLLLDEPTRGVDIIAKEEIYRLMENLVSEGVGILMVSSELQEVLRIADRIIVMHEGCIKGELNKDQFSEESVVNLSTGGC